MTTDWGYWSSLEFECGVQSGAVFGEPATPRKGSIKARRKERNAPGKLQRRMQRKADDDYVTEGGEGLARSTTMPW